MLFLFLAASVFVYNLSVTRGHMHAHTHMHARTHWLRVHVGLNRPLCAYRNTIASHQVISLWLQNTYNQRHMTTSMQNNQGMQANLCNRALSHLMHESQHMTCDSLHVLNGSSLIVDWESLSTCKRQGLMCVSWSKMFVIIVRLDYIVRLYSYYICYYIVIIYIVI